MMNIKNESPVIPEGEEEEEDVGQYIIKPKRMTDVVPEPGTKEDKFVDTGLKLGSMDLSSI